jgi:hypothetical protein
MPGVATGECLICMDDMICHRHHGGSYPGPKQQGGLCNS